MKLATALACHTGNEKEIFCQPEGSRDLAVVLEHLDGRFPGFKAIICPGTEDIADSINIYVNGDNVRYLKGLQTPLEEGDVINIIPAAAAG